MNCKFLFGKMERWQSGGILKLKYDREQANDSIIPAINWNDEQAVEYEIAINCLHNYAVGKMMPELQGKEGQESIREKRCLKFADEIDIKIFSSMKQTESCDTAVCDASDFESVE